MTTPTILEVDTPSGPGRWLLHGNPAAPTLLAMAPGHSGHLNAADLVALARRADDATAVALWTPPFVVAGRRSGSPPAVLDAAWLVAAPVLRAHHREHRRFVQGGHSAGARMACRTARETGAAAVLACSFPLHPPGRPASSRSGELLDSGVPVLVLQGSRDTFGTADDVAAAVAARSHPANIRIHEVTGAGHNLVPTKRADPDGVGLSAAIAVAWTWIRTPPSAPA